MRGDEENCCRQKVSVSWALKVKVTSKAPKKVIYRRIRRPAIEETPFRSESGWKTLTKDGKFLLFSPGYILKILPFNDDVIVTW